MLTSIAESISRDALASGSRVVGRSEPDASAFRLIVFVLILVCGSGAYAAEPTARERFESLKKTVLTAGSRVVNSETVPQTEARVGEREPLVPASHAVVTSSWQLAEAARECEALDELLEAVQPLADRRVENAQALLQLIQIARGQGAKWEPSLQKFVKDRRAAWAAPLENSRDRLRVSADDVMVATAALRDAELRRSGIGFANAILQQSYAANFGTYLPQMRRELGIAMLRQVPGSTEQPSADPGLQHWVSGSLDRLYVNRSPNPQVAPSAWWVAHEGLVSHVCGADQDLLFLRTPLEGRFEFACECWAEYWGESNLGYGGLICDTLHGGQRTTIFPAGGHEERGTHKAQERWDDWNRIRIVVDTDQQQASWFVNDHLIYTDRDIGRTSPWLSLHAYGVCRATFRNPRIIGEPKVPEVVNLSDSDRLEGWVSSFFNESQPPRRDMAQRNQLLNRVRQNRAKAEDLFDWSSRDSEIRGRRVTAQVDEENAALPSRLYYHRPLGDGEKVFYQFFYDPEAKQHVHPTLGRIAFVLEPDGVRLLELGEATETVRRIAALGRPSSTDRPAETRTAEGGHPTKLPLKSGEWNAVSVSLDDGTATVKLNNEIIFERPVAATHDLHVGFFHDKSQTEAKIRSVGMTGDWGRLGFLPYENLLEPRERVSSENRQAKAAVSSERYHQLAVRDVVKQARSMPPPKRFEELANWVIPGHDHLSWRLFGAFTPTNPAPVGSDGSRTRESSDDGANRNRSLTTSATTRETSAIRRRVVEGEFESPAFELIAVAKQLDKLAVLEQRILNASESVGDVLPSHDVKAQMAFAVLLSIANENLPDAEQALQELLKLAAADPPDLPQIQRWPEFTAVMASLNEPALWLTAELLAKQLVDQNNSHYQGYWWEVRVRYLLDQVRSRRATGATNSKDQEPRTKRTTAPTQWHPHGAFTSHDRSSGLTPRWEMVAGELQHRAGEGFDLLSFQSPLRGSFVVTCELPFLGWREKELIYGTRFAAPYQSRQKYVTGSFLHGGETHETNLPPIHEFHELKLVVKPGTATTFVNGRKLHEEPLADDCDPWLVVRTLGHFSGWVRNLRITGEPIIPMEIDLLAGSDLSSWFDVYFQNPRANERLADGTSHPLPYWERRDDMIVGARINDKQFAGSQTETVLHYHRPLAEDGEIEYEFFFHQPDTSSRTRESSGGGTSDRSLTTSATSEPPIAVHPALDRLTFLLRPDGVAVHWMTDGQFDVTGALPGNIVVEKSNRRGPNKLPLKDDDWNKLKLSLRGDVVTLTLNDQAIYERSLEATNQRNFGLFRYADESEARVRNIVFRGDWPKTLPKVEDQELATNVNRLARFEPNELPDSRHWNFRGDWPKWIVPTFDLKKFGSLMKATDDGLVLSMPPGRSLPGDILGLEATSQLSGDFEMLVKFQILQLERSDLATSFKVPGLDIGVTLQSPTSDLLRMERRLFEDREQGHAIKSVHRWNAPGQPHSYGIQQVPQPALAGRMKLIRKGPRVMTFFADNDSDRWQMIHQHSVPQDDAIKPTVLVRNYDSKSDVSVLLQDWVIRAVTISE